jgi:hypothetical protein
MGVVAALFLCLKVVRIVALCLYNFEIIIFFIFPCGGMFWFGAGGDIVYRIFQMVCIFFRFDPSCVSKLDSLGAGLLTRADVASPMTSHVKSHTFVSKKFSGALPTSGVCNPVFGIPLCGTNEEPPLHSLRVKS